MTQHSSAAEKIQNLFNKNIDTALIKSIVDTIRPPRRKKMLAEEMGVTPQYINKVVKGKENLTLETISKIEQVLGIILFEVPSTETSVIIHVNQGNTYRTVSSKDATYLAKYEVEYSNEYLSESICNYG